MGRAPLFLCLVLIFLVKDNAGNKDTSVPSPPGSTCNKSDHPDTWVSGDKCCRCKKGEVACRQKLKTCPKSAAGAPGCVLKDFCGCKVWKCHGKARKGGSDGGSGPARQVTKYNVPPIGRRVVYGKSSQNGRGKRIMRGKKGNGDEKNHSDGGRPDGHKNGRGSDRQRMKNQGRSRGQEEQTRSNPLNSRSGFTTERKMAEASPGTGENETSSDYHSTYNYEYFPYPSFNYVSPIGLNCYCTVDQYYDYLYYDWWDYENYDYYGDFFDDFYNDNYYDTYGYYNDIYDEYDSEGETANEVDKGKGDLSFLETDEGKGKDKGKQKDKGRNENENKGKGKHKGSGKGNRKDGNKGSGKGNGKDDNKGGGKENGKNENK